MPFQFVCAPRRDGPITERSHGLRVSPHGSSCYSGEKGGNKMSNIIFWMALVILPILAGSAFAYLRHYRHHGDDF
ncbi:hypothetical protein DKP76_06520 [Falsochrobactrum shanghaiense]|uniref:Uncharacterized protein n=1 Tax=Falsochrobactrum shanghaiense TaxID=2201899 RepID=A0A316JHM0_9HYPH|nr:hypothetical protein DKP76_06520 [Falsochrobactrum shanghaiense]